MFESDKRYVSAICNSKTCTLLTIKRSDLQSLMLGNTKKVNKNNQMNNDAQVQNDTLEDKLQILSWNKLVSLSKKINNMKEMTENIGNQNKKKNVLVDEKSIEKVKHKIDREYERVFLKQMTKMKIIKQSKAIKEINK